jgi:Protein involved in formate dehydrogenase formation
VIETGTERSVATAFESRSARASLLAGRSEGAREPLALAALLCDEQARLAIALEDCALSGRLIEDSEKLVPLQAPLIHLSRERGPEKLAEAGRSRAGDDAATARSRLEVCWSGDATGADDYLSRALLQPYVEVLRARKVDPDRPHHRGRCPFCGSKPWIGVLRPASDADAGFRFLGCSLCGLEWRFNRVACPSCFEEDPHKLPVFQGDAHPLVRIEACETCGRYLKSIDLTQDLRPVPAIDDLVSLSMDLWALEAGFSRIEPGLAGI